MSTPILITGASTGIGRCAALDLDQRGHRVFAGVRSQADAQALRQAASERLTPITLDVTRAEDIQAAAAQIKERLEGQPLMGLVNNAGVAVPGPLEVLPLEELRWQLEVNVIGVVAVTQAMLPLLRPGPGRIVNVGSISGKISSPFVGAYSASKHALEAITDALRAELAPWDIWTCVIEPGQVATPIWDKADDVVQQARQKFGERGWELYGEAMQAASRVIHNGRTRGVAPEAVAKAIHHALTAPRPRTRYLVGPDARGGAALRWLLPDKAFDAAIRKLNR